MRKAPQVYNESKFISYATYNAMFIMCFINVLRYENGITSELKITINTESVTIAVVNAI